MKTITLDQIVRKDIPLAYRRTYNAQAVLNGRNTGESRCAIEFDIEHTPLGTRDINVRFNDRPSCPLLPLRKQLKERIADLDSEGSLP